MRPSLIPLLAGLGLGGWGFANDPTKYLPANAAAPRITSNQRTDRKNARRAHAAGFRNAFA